MVYLGMVMWSGLGYGKGRFTAHCSGFQGSATVWIGRLRCGELRGRFAHKITDLQGTGGDW